MAIVATLISNPSASGLTHKVAHSAATAVGASSIVWLAEGIACDLAIQGPADLRATERLIRRALPGLPIDIAVQPAAGRRKKLLLADMDSTVIGQECIDELALLAGLQDRVAAITARAMNGDIAFEPALRERVALLKGLPAGVIDEVLATRITLTPGAIHLVRTMKAHGAHTVLVSGGFTAFSGPIAEWVGFDEHHANTLLCRNGLLEGAVAEPILGKRAKRETLFAVAARLGIAPDDAIAVGDGANDLDMLDAAGTGVALHAKPRVAEAAGIRIDHGDLTALLYVQGYRQEEFLIHGTAAGAIPSGV